MGRTSDARQRLMDAAYSLICEYSYGAVTIEAICDRAGVKKGSFYYFFESKSDLAVTTINTWWKEREILLRKLFDKEKPPVERLRDYLDLITQLQVKAFEGSGQLLGCPLFTFGAEICTQDERIRVRILQFLNSVLTFFTEAISDGQTRGEIPGNDPQTKARALLCFYEGILTLARIENKPELVHNLTQQALEAIGIGAVVRTDVPQAA